MAPRKNAGAEAAAPAPELTADNIDDLDDAAYEAAKAQMDAGMDDEPADAEEAPEKAAEPASAPKADEAKGEEDDDSDAEEGEKQDFVPHGRFHNERERRKAAEQRAEQAAKRFDELMAIMRGQQSNKEQPAQQEQPKQEQWIDPKKDIFGAYAQLQRHLAGVVNQNNQTRQQTEQERQQQAIINESDADIIAYRQEVPESEAAIAYLRDMRVRELNAFGVMDPHTIRNDLLKIQADVAALAKQRGVRVGKMLHELAVARGFQPPKPAPNANGSNGAAAPAAANNADAATAAQKAMQAVLKSEDTKQRAQSLGGSGAPVELGELSSEDILNLTDAEYDKLKEKLAKEGKDIMDIGFGAQ